MHEDSSMKEKHLNKWEDFEAELLQLQKERSAMSESTGLGTTDFLYRGQRDASWPLATTLERRVAKPLTWDQYYRLVVAAKPQIETFTKQRWDIPDFPELVKWAQSYKSVHLEPLPGYDYLIYLRHHGFPSPLLDWTASPYVAAFFAFTYPGNSDRIAVYAYLEHAAHGKTTCSGDPTILCPGPYVRSHSRHFLQQSQYTICASYDESQWRFCPHQEALSDGPNIDIQDLSWKFTLPASERRAVLKLLDAHNLNAFSLFQTEEALLEMVAMREIEFRDKEL
jgi:hypothetical protein